MDYFYVLLEIPSLCWAGIKLDKPEAITSISYLPRNDGNSVEINNEYVLFYWKNGWREIERKTAYHDSLVFSDVPENALYLLRNITKGKEERIFTYVNNRQVWW